MPLAQISFKESIMAKFISKSHVAINVVMPNGANVHVSFLEKTGGGSILYTDNQDLTNALRQHQKYGRLFKEVEMPAAQPAVRKAEPAEGAEAKTANAQKPKQAASNEPREIEFKNNEDAKDYLAERYGISRSKMKTRAAIEEVAKGVKLKVKWVS